MPALLPRALPRTAMLCERNHRSFWGSANPTRLTERRRLSIPVATMFDVVLDVDRYNEFLPYCVGSKVTRRNSPSSFEADLVIGFGTVNASYTSVVDFQRGATSLEPWVIQVRSFFMSY